MKKNTPTSRKKLRALRVFSGQNQVDLAKKTGVTQAFISLIETGKKMPGPETMRALEKVFDADLKGIFNDE